MDHGRPPQFALKAVAGNVGRANTDPFSQAGVNPGLIFPHIQRCPRPAIRSLEPFIQSLIVDHGTTAGTDQNLV